MCAHKKTPQNAPKSSAETISSSVKFCSILKSRLIASKAVEMIPKSRPKAMPPNEAENVMKFELNRNEFRDIKKNTIKLNNDWKRIENVMKYLKTLL